MHNLCMTCFFRCVEEIHHDEIFVYWTLRPDNSIYNGEVLKICKRRRSLKRVVLFNHTFRKRRLIFQMIFIAEKLLQFLSRLRIKLSLIPKLILSLEKLDAHYFRNEYYLIYVVFICKFQKAYLHWTRAENHLKRFKTRR